MRSQTSSNDSRFLNIANSRLNFRKQQNFLRIRSTEGQSMKFVSKKSEQKEKSSFHTYILKRCHRNHPNTHLFRFVQFLYSTNLCYTDNFNVKETIDILIAKKWKVQSEMDVIYRKNVPLFFYLKLFSGGKGSYYAKIMKSTLILFYIQTTFNIFPFNAFNQISRVQ